MADTSCCFPLFTLTKVFRNTFLYSLFLIISSMTMSMLFILVSSHHQFQVGGENGWQKPTSSNFTAAQETYNQWATINRFLIGDTLYFKYQRDSVLVVNSTDYQKCNTSNPINKFEDGNTLFRFDRAGFFYFISGQPGHCRAGQKLVIRVLHHSEKGLAPAPAPSPEMGGESTDGEEGWGPSAVNSTTKQSVVSYFMTFLGSTLVVLYWLM